MADRPTINRVPSHLVRNDAAEVALADLIIQGRAVLPTGDVIVLQPSEIDTGYLPPPSPDFRRR